METESEKIEIFRSAAFFNSLKISITDLPKVRIIKIPVKNSFGKKNFIKIHILMIKIGPSR